MMDSSLNSTYGGIGTGVAVGALTAIATHSLSASLATGGAATLLGGVAIDQVANVSDRYDKHGIGVLAKPSVSLAVTAGAIGAGALGAAGSGGLGGPARVAAVAASGIFGAAAALSALNLFNLE